MCSPKDFKNTFSLLLCCLKVLPFFSFFFFAVYIIQRHFDRSPKLKILFIKWLKITEKGTSVK